VPPFVHTKGGKEPVGDFILKKKNKKKEKRNLDKIILSCYHIIKPKKV